MLTRTSLHLVGLILLLLDVNDYPEVRVDIPGGLAIYPAVATSPLGHSLVVWQGALGIDSNGIVARPLGFDGRPTGPEFSVNETVAGVQWSASIATLTRDRFVVVWESPDSVGTGGIFGRVINGDGTYVSPEFHVDPDAAGHQYEPSVAANSDGQIVVAWASNEASQSDDNVYARLFDETGMAMGPQLRVNDDITGRESDPDVAVGMSGDFVVVYENDLRVYGQRYDHSGVPLGANFPVSTGVLTQNWPRVEIDHEGRFVIAWQGYDVDGDGGGILARLYNREGVAESAPFVVNSDTVGIQNAPDVAMTSTGEFLIVWASGAQDVRGQRFDRLGNPEGAEFKVNESGSPHSPLVSADLLGYEVTWFNSNVGIRARRIDVVPTRIGDTGEVCKIVSRAYPNPFNPIVTIDFTVPRAGRLRLVVFDVRGEVVKRLIDGFLSEGPSRVVWDGRTEEGTQAPTGLYFYRIEVAGYQTSGKILLAK